MGTMIQRGLPCEIEGCGSSNAVALYEDDSTKERYRICFSGNCPSEGKAVFEGGSNAVGDSDDSSGIDNEADEVDTSKSWIAPYLKGSDRTWKERKISDEALSKYGIKYDNKSKSYMYPYFNKQKDMVGFKARPLGHKDFYLKGDTKVVPKLLFGKEVFSAGGKTVTITEGENDAVAVYQMFGCKYPSVSVPVGSKGALQACKDNYEWLDSFSKIVISFDADEAGQKAAKEVASLFNGKSYIMEMDPDFKDANGYLMAGASKEFTNLWWSAKEYIPDGIIMSSSMRDRMKVPRAEPICPWPMNALNEKLYGIFPGKIYTFTAGSGTGKTSMIKELQYWLFKQTEQPIGMLMLEEASEDSILGLMSIHLNKPLHVPTTVYTQEEYDNAFDATAGTDRFVLHDHFGSSGIDNIYQKVKYMAKVKGCKFIFLDHLSIIVSAQLEQDERKAIDEIMTKLRMLVQETGVALFLVSHLKRVTGKEYTEGAQISTSDLRGSASIEQLSDVVIALERNGQSKNQKIANTTNVRVLKNRQFGQLGLTSGMFYDRMTGRMTETGLVDTTTEEVDTL